MNNLEKRMVNTLSDLAENHNVIGVKAEFEAEGTRFEEAVRLKEVVTKAGLELTIKIGGCEALKDMYDSRVIGVNTVVAPMIESPYALQKYIKSAKTIFSEHEQKEIKFFINIETITGLNNIDAILSDKEAENLDGVVFGRADMCGSLGLTREYVNSDIIFDYANKLAQKALEYNKEFVIGGGVSKHSIPFFKKLPHGCLSRFETRKVIFEGNAIENDNIESGLMKAVDFELLWLKNKRDFYRNICEEDSQRLQMLENIYAEFTEKVGGIYG